MQYRTFMGRDISLTRDYASLRDNFDNIYKRIDFGFGAKPAGATESESIYPGKAISDVLVFEPPIEAAEYLNLELPAECFGGTGMLRIRIPAGMIIRPGGPNPHVVEHRRKEPSIDKAPAQPKIPVCDPVRRGDVEVSVTEVSIRKVGLIGASSGKEFQSSESYLRIDVEIRNLGTAPVAFSPWEKGTASLHDDRGRECEFHDFAPTYSVSGAVERETLASGQSTSVVLVFNRPAAGFGAVTLELPVANFGGDGEPVRMGIPAAKIKR